MRRWQRKVILVTMVLAVSAAWVLQGGPAQSAPPNKDTWQTAVAALQTQIDSQNSLISALQNTVNTLQNTVANQAGQITSLQNNMPNGNLVALGNHVQVVEATIKGLKGPHIIFEGANVHVRSGVGATSDNNNLSGLGNVVVGYNEDDVSGVSYIRTGSHNLIVGIRHSYSGFGGLVAGVSNTISNVGS
jgi:hypothetical protein